MLGGCGGVDEAGVQGLLQVGDVVRVEPRAAWLRRQRVVGCGCRLVEQLGEQAGQVVTGCDLVAGLTTSSRAF